MDIVKIVAVGMIAAILAITLKKNGPEFSLVISISASVLILIMVLPHLTSVVEILKDLSQKVGADISYISIVLKIIGISYIAEFGSQICMDAGESAIASKIEIGGKVLIMVISAPVLLALIELIGNILPK